MPILLVSLCPVSFSSYPCVIFLRCFIYMQEDISAQGKLLLQDNFIVWNIHNKMLRQITKLRGKNRQVFLYEKCLIFTKKEPRELDEGKDDYVYQFKSLLKVCCNKYTISMSIPSPHLFITPLPHLSITPLPYLSITPLPHLPITPSPPHRPLNLL